MASDEHHITSEPLQLQITRNSERLMAYYFMASAKRHAKHLRFAVCAALSRISARSLWRTFRKVHWKWTGISFAQFCSGHLDSEIVMLSRPGLGLESPRRQRLVSLASRVLALRLALNVIVLTAMYTSLFHHSFLHWTDLRIIVFL